MTNQEILFKVISKAGCSNIPRRKFYFNPHEYHMKEIVLGLAPYEPLIFSHEFAKAFWGEETIDHMISDDDMVMGDFGEEWEYHLRQMVLEKEPLKYLEEWL